MELPVAIHCLCRSHRLDWTYVRSHRRSGPRRGPRRDDLRAGQAPGRALAHRERRLRRHRRSHRRPGRAGRLRPRRPRRRSPVPRGRDRILLLRSGGLADGPLLPPRTRRRDPHRRAGPGLHPAGQPGPRRRRSRRNPHSAQGRDRATPARPGRTRPRTRQTRRSPGVADPDGPKRVQRQRARHRTDPDVPGRGRPIPRTRRNRPTRPLLPTPVPDGERDGSGQRPARPRSRRRPHRGPGPPDRPTPGHPQPDRQADPWATHTNPDNQPRQPQRQRQPTTANQEPGGTCAPPTGAEPKPWSSSAAEPPQPADPPQPPPKPRSWSPSTTTPSTDAVRGAGHTLDGTVLSPQSVRKLACDASIIPMVLGSKSQPLDVGRTKRLVTPALLAALWARDKGCTFPELRATTPMVRRPPRQTLDRRRTHLPTQPRVAVRLPPPPLAPLGTPPTTTT